MTTSGNTAFALDHVEIIEEAFERCGLEVRGGYDMRSALRSCNLVVLDWANEGINLWTVDDRSQALTADDGTYTLGTDVVDILYASMATPEAPDKRFHVTRVALPRHTQRNNPALTGRPYEMYVDRQRDAPEIHLWPLPSASGYTLYYWVLRRIQDAGVGVYTNTPDMPFRFLPAFIAALAAKIAGKRRTDDPNLVAKLESDARGAFARAAREDRDRASLRIVPKVARVR